LQAKRSGGTDICSAPLAPMRREAEASKADDHHRPDWRFRSGNRSNLDGGIGRKAIVIGQEGRFRVQFLIPADEPERDRPVIEIVDIQPPVVKQFAPPPAMALQNRIDAPAAALATVKIPVGVASSIKSVVLIPDPGSDELPLVPSLAVNDHDRICSRRDRMML
jgi:hypothetical protein